jgi:TM2 domain-containing membrane protein YozV
MSQTASSHAAPRLRNKTLAGLLAFLLGWAGAHGFYLGRRYSWLPLLMSLAVLGYATTLPGPVYSHGIYYLWLIPLVAGFIEAVVLCLRSDAKFDARYNPGLSPGNQSGWGAIVVAAFSLFIGTAILMAHVLWLFMGIVEGTVTF